MAITSDQARQALTALRLGLGGAAWLAPRQTARLYGLDPDDNPAAPYLGRLYGARELAIGTVLLEGDSDDAERWVDYSTALSGADLLASIAGGLRGYLPKRAAIMTALTALGAIVLGIIARED